MKKSARQKVFDFFAEFPQSSVNACVRATGLSYDVVDAARGGLVTSRLLAPKVGRLEALRKFLLDANNHANLEKLNSISLAEEFGLKRGTVSSLINNMDKAGILNKKLYYVCPPKKVYDTYLSKDATWDENSIVYDQITTQDFVYMLNLIAAGSKQFSVEDYQIARMVSQRVILEDIAATLKKKVPYTVARIEKIGSRLNKIRSGKKVGYKAKTPAKILV